MLPKVNLIRGDDVDYLLFATTDAVTTNIYLSGSWEPHLTVISRLFYQGVTEPFILDIGANLGAYAIPIAKEIQASGGFIYSYEPQRIVYYQLCGNIFLNRLDNVNAFCMAVGDEDGTVTIPPIDYGATSNIGGFSLDEGVRQELDCIALAKTGLVTETPIARLDSMTFPKAPCLVKIDVEGFDLRVLAGGLEFLEKSNFPPILFEAWDFDWFKAEKAKIFDLLDKIGYQSTRLLEDNYIAQHPLHPVHFRFQIGETGALNIQRTR